MAKTYIKCAKCSDFQAWTEAYTFNLERNSGCNIVENGTFRTYICSACALKAIKEFLKEENNEGT